MDSVSSNISESLDAETISLPLRALCLGPEEDIEVLLFMFEICVNAVIPVSIGLLLKCKYRWKVL